MIHGLIANLAVVGLFVSVWFFAKEALVRHTHGKRVVALGILVGLGSIATMAMAVRTQDGLLFDLRFALLATGAFLEGPIVGVIAALAAIRPSVGRAARAAVRATRPAVRTSWAMSSPRGVRQGADRER